MTAPCPRGPHGPVYPTRTRAKAAQRQARKPRMVRVVQCAACGWIHLEKSESCHAPRNLARGTCYIACAHYPTW